MARTKVTFYLPMRDNDGRGLSVEIAEVEDVCYQAFGAWTFAGYIRGAWRLGSTGERKIDTSLVYTIVLPEERVGEVEGILRDFKAKTRQEAIYMEVAKGVDVRFL